MSYDVGDLVKIRGVFTDGVTEGAVDPTKVYFRVKDPALNVTIYEYGEDVELVKDSTGNYHVDVDITMEGNWYGRFYSTGTGQAAGEQLIVVQPSHFP